MAVLITFNYWFTFCDVKKKRLRQDAQGNTVKEQNGGICERAVVSFLFIYLFLNHLNCLVKKQDMFVP